MVGILIPFTEIIIIAMMINYLLSFFWNTRAMDLISGLLVYVGVFILATALKFPVLQTLLLYVINVAVIAILIIFQPELRLALSRIGAKGRETREISEFDVFLDQLTQSVYRLADKHIGAILVMEYHDSLEELANQGVRVDAVFSSELVESIFMTTTPLHDGAVLLRESMVLSAATILPLADDTSNLAKSMGTRHRAALGISQQSDAFVIVVSEETGRVSVARDGIMTKGVKIDRFKGIVRSLFAQSDNRLTFSQQALQWIKKLGNG